MGLHFGALGAIAGLIVVTYAMAMAMAMAIIERSRELGTLRALGSTPGQLVQGLALEGLMRGGLDAAAGALLAPTAAQAPGLHRQCSA